MGQLGVDRHSMLLSWYACATRRCYGVDRRVGDRCVHRRSRPPHECLL